MKKLKYLFICALVALVSVSCNNDPKEVLVTINRAGSAEIKVVDNSNRAIADARVVIYPSSSWSTLDEGVTDNSGIFKTINLLQGTYFGAVSAVRNNMTFWNEAMFQIIAGEVNVVEINAFADAGHGMIRLRNTATSGSQLPTLNIVMWPRNSHNWGVFPPIEDAYFTGQTNAEDILAFPEIPGNQSYTFLIYSDTPGSFVSFSREIFVRSGINNIDIDFSFW